MFSLLRLRSILSALPHRTARFSWVLVWALLCAQGLGIWHRVEHGYALPGLAELAYDAAEDAEDDARAKPRSREVVREAHDPAAQKAEPAHWHHLAGHAACLLLDQLLLGDLHLEAAWAVLQLDDFEQAFPHALNAGWLEHFFALFLARAPPVLR